MLNYKSEYEHEAFSNYEDVKAFSEAMRKSQGQNPDDKKVFVWKGFGNQISDELFKRKNWQQDFVKLLGDQVVWQWKYRFVGDKLDRSGNPELIDALGSPSREVMAYLPIRTFDSKDTFVGSLEWFEGLTSNISKEDNEYKVIVDNVIQRLRDAEKVGVKLLLEQISVINNPDPETPMTVTPNLHRDLAYGHLEAAIVTFYDNDFTPNASTLFFPDFDLGASEHLGLINAEKLRDHFPDASVHSIASGSLAVISGEKNKDGVSSKERGALHVSPEGFFPTRRLVFMFRCWVG